MVEEIREPQISIDNVRVQQEEVLPDSAKARVLVAERSNEDRGLTVVVELEMDASLGKNGALVLRKSRAHLSL